MEEHMFQDNQGQQEPQLDGGWEPRTTGINRWLLIGGIALLVVAGLAFGYGYSQQVAVGHLTAQQSAATATIDQLQNQVNTVTAKLNDMVATQQAAAQAAEQAVTEKKTTGKHGAPTDKRFKELKAQLDDQGKQLKDTEDQVAKNRTDLEASLSSTKDELNGSIAKTHEELVTLQKRGERSYFEFDLAKSKQFQRFGPLTLSLRRTDGKHLNYDLSMVVDDHRLDKKHVNLYEPIWIHSETGGQPLQIVVNKIGRNTAHGYISVPKYRESELASSTGGTPALTPVSATAPADPNRPNQQPDQPPQTQPQQQPPQPQ